MRQIKMKILELFCGTKSFSNVAKERGHEVFTVDIDPYFEPDLEKNILDLKIEDIPFKPDFIWASPPCNCFSVASLRHHWEDGQPKNDKVIEAMLYVVKTIALIKALRPKYWIIENPRGMLRKQWFMKELPRTTVTYCQYGDFRQKPTDLWNNLGLLWRPKPMCKPGDACHESAKRGTDKGTQAIGGGGKRGSVDRARVPRQLCEEILTQIKNKELK